MLFCTPGKELSQSADILPNLTLATRDMMDFDWKASEAMRKTSSEKDIEKDITRKAAVKSQSGF